MPRKSLYLSLLSFAYLQVGFRSTLFLITPRQLSKTVDARPVAEQAMPVMAA